MAKHRLWSPEEATHHNYLELLAAFLAIKAFGKTWQSVSVTAHRQYHSSKLYQSERGHSPQATVPIDYFDVDMVQRAKDNPPGRTSTRLA